MSTTARTTDDPLGVISVENLLCAGLILGVFVTGIQEEALADSVRYRNLGLLVAAGLICAAIIQSLGPRAQPRHHRDLLVPLAALYFGWTAAQDYFLQSDLNGATQSAIGFLVTLAALRANLELTIDRMRRWLTVALLVFLVPAFTGQGFETGERVWVDVLPGRYFGFSNPNNLGVLAGLLLLLSIRTQSRGRRRALMFLSLGALVITSGYTAAVALGLGLLAYVGLGRVRNVGPLTNSVGALALLTPGLLLWLPTNHALGLLSDLQLRFDLSGRSYLWVYLARVSRDSGHFWIGLGDRKVGQYTYSLMGVSSAHSTLLQLFLAAGFITATLFVVVVAVAAIQLLNAWAVDMTQSARLACAVLVYWFVVSLASTTPGTGLGLALMIVLVIARPRPRAEVDEREPASVLSR